MSDNEATPTKGNAWTESAKMQFLMRIVAQFRADGKSINWGRIQMEGRTTKSLQNQWTKMVKEISELETAEAGDGGGTPTKPKATPRKGRVAKVEKSEAIVTPGISDDDGEEKPKSTPKKRAATPRRGGGKPAAKKVKRDDAEDEALANEGEGVEGASEA